MVDRDYDEVLFIKMEHGQITSIERMSRRIYINSRGRYIKTTSDGNVPLDDNNVAVLAYKHDIIKRAGRADMRAIRKYHPTAEEVRMVIRNMFEKFPIE